MLRRPGWSNLDQVVSITNSGPSQCEIATNAASLAYSKVKAAPEHARIHLDAHRVAHEPGKSPENGPFPKPSGGRANGPLSFTPLPVSVLSGSAPSRLDLGSGTYAQLVFGAQPVFDVVAISSTFCFEERVSQHSDVVVLAFGRGQIVIRVVFLHLQSFLVLDPLPKLFDGRCSGPMSSADCSFATGRTGHSQSPDICFHH